MFCKYYESVKEMNTCIVHYVLLLNMQLEVKQMSNNKHVYFKDKRSFV